MEFLIELRGKLTKNVIEICWGLLAKLQQTKQTTERICIKNRVEGISLNLRKESFI
jgi:hypothetical protein